MATQTLDDRITYKPGYTLGGNGYQPGPDDRLHERIGHLDALLSFISITVNQDDGAGLFVCNNEIQREVLNLACSLASEINELHREITLRELRGNLGGVGDKVRAIGPSGQC